MLLDGFFVFGWLGVLFCGQITAFPLFSIFSPVYGSQTEMLFGADRPRCDTLCLNQNYQNLRIFRITAINAFILLIL